MGTVNRESSGSAASSGTSTLSSGREPGSGRTLWTMVRGFCQQGASQAIGAACLLLLVSDRYSLLDPELTTLLILFMQWQVFGLTIAKLGAEQTVFAVVSGNPRVRFDARRHVLTRSLPLAAIFALTTLALFPPWAAVVLVTSIAFDTWSLLRIADLNARGAFGITATANLLNYPLFFALIFAGTLFFDLGFYGIFAAFAIASAARCLYLATNPPPAGTSLVVARGNLAMGMQQAMNYGLFRLDELLLAALVIGADAMLGREYVFQARFPQIASIGAVLLGVVVFPRFHLEMTTSGRPQLVSMPFRRLYLIAFALAAVVAAFAMNAAYQQLLWAAPTTLSTLPFVFHACAILPVNLITYSMLRAGCLQGLLRNLAASLGVGGLYLALAWATGSNWPEALTWLPPIQLATMIFLSLLFSWGTPRNAYETAGSQNGGQSVVRQPLRTAVLL
jgi:hypothetical protein